MLSIIKNLKEKLAKTKNNFIGKIAEAVKLRGKVDEDLMDELEEILLQSDIGSDLSIEIIDRLREQIRLNKITDPTLVQTALENIIKKILKSDYADELESPYQIIHNPHVVLFVGVNGVGKTTTIGKIARQFKDKGKSVMLVAADTFRAAAIEQLEIWAQRVDCPIIKQQHGADPSSVVYDGLRAAVHQKVDVLLIDTAGRLHNKVNLMKELDKMNRTMKKVLADAPHETYLVIDATTGQNAISQARTFKEVTDLTGIVLTKLDGTAKGGIVIGIKHQLQIPVRFIGVGETVDDLKVFNPDEFVEALFE
ncbi:MAG: signal recognition particle-docking protein FtsY [Candidatus Cloacimonetes bacterium]|nr:signal recognition particle-docking protein FtsY [Candidatus Cloacimonadota bacterium]